MLILHPLPASCEPPAVALTRSVADNSDHPDRAEIGRACDVLAHALIRLTEIAQTMTDASARDTLLCAQTGVAAAIGDALGDLRFAVECWADHERNAFPYGAEAAAYADYVIESRKEDAA